MRIYYEVAGDGPALVLIHGADGGGGEVWHSNGYVEAFSSHFTTLTLDIRGYGRSSAPETLAEISMASRVRDVTMVLDHLGVERASVFGFSMGGRVAVAFAMERPERVRCLVVGSSNPEPFTRNRPMAEGRSFVNRFRRLTPRRAVAAAWRRINPSARRAMQNPVSPSTSMAMSIAGSEGIDFRDVMRPLAIDIDRAAERPSGRAAERPSGRAAERITMPTLFFQGNRDDLFSARLSRAFAERLAEGEFVALRGQGHAILERRDLVQPIVEPFLLQHGQD